MKKAVSILIVISLLIMQMPVLAVTGEGTEANPYLVSSVSDVLAIHNDIDGYYKLTQSIDMSGVEFTPIGNEHEGAFTGTIDGGGYTISNLDIYLPDNKYVGFVGYLEGTVKNLHIANANSFGYCYVGGIVGYAGESAIIDNCTLSGDAGGKYQIVDVNIGGIVGYNAGKINKCINQSAITGAAYNLTYDYYYIGGITGYNNYGTISGCSNMGTVTVNCDFVGGIAGYNNYGTISGCSNTGTVTEGEESGGIAGSNNYGTIIGCSNAGSITGNSSHYSGVGGIAGYNGYGTISGCSNTGSVIGGTFDAYAGGIAGDNYYGTINECSNTGDVTGDRTGGIAGYNYSNSIIRNCINDGYITGTSDDASGIASGNGGAVYNCKNSGTVKASYTADGIGGTAYNCVNTGTLNGYTTYDITDGSIYNITLSSYSVRRGSSVMMPIELYEYDRELTWSSSDNTVATVDPKGVVTGLKVGSVTITAVTELGISTSALLTVTEKLPDSITLSKQNITLQKGFTDRISVLFSPSDASDEVTLTSSNQDVATVTQDGLITALMPGSSTVKAETSNGKIAYCAVTVTEPNISVASVTLDKTSLTMMKDDTAQLNADVLPENATNKTLAWSSSDESVAEVGGTGVVTAKESGVAVITATAANGMYHSCVVKVVSASGPSVVLSDANVFGYTPSGVTASIVKNPGISAYKFTVSYDEAMLTPVSVIPNEEFGGNFTTNLDDPNREKLTVLWYSDSDVETDGELFTVNFKLNEGYTSGSCAVTLDYGDKDICNTAGDSIALYINDASVAVAKPVPGDVYEDGEVTVYDLTLLSRYVTGLETLTERQLEAADVNNDGDVDIKDVVRLAQHLAGWSNAELVSAAELSGSAAVTVGSAAADKNGEAEIPVSINGSGGISGFRYNLEYNSGELEILEIIPSELTKQTLQTNLGSENDEGLIVTWYKGDGDMPASGELFKIRARLKGDNPSRISIKANDNNMCDSDLNNVLGTYNAGTVTPYAAAPTATPTNGPTATPTDAPTATPTEAPTATPANAPTPTPTNAPMPTRSPDLSDVENIEPVGDYVGKVKITKTVKDDEITITVTGAVSGAGDVDLTAVTLYAAEYDETDEVLKELTLGDALVSDGILTLTTTIPKSQNYKLLLWDNKFRPLTNAIIN